jgi:putative phosphoribosyl transferase
MSGTMAFIAAPLLLTKGRSSLKQIPDGKKGWLMFRNRVEAGIRLAEKLGKYKDRGDALVLALPRGGVVTGYEVARSLNIPLDVLIVRKIGFPGQEELAAGAVSETGSVVLNRDIVSAGHLADEFLRKEIDRQKQEIARRVAFFRAGRRLAGLEGKVVILVDDGVATGATVKAAIAALKEEKIARLVLALPVGPPEAIELLRKMVDELVCLEAPLYFMAVGAHYQDFTQVTDDEVVKLLRKSAAKAA